jgi:hypothetical protein
MTSGHRVDAPGPSKIKWSDTEHFLIDLIDWKADYSFGIEDPKLFGVPWNDYQHLVVTGEVRRPSRFAKRPAKVSLLPSEAFSFFHPKRFRWIAAVIRASRSEP